MEILIKQATIIHHESVHHHQVRDILISDGYIKSIATEIKNSKAKIIEGNQLHCCIGLCDIGTHSGEPGYEHRETIQSLTRTALKGGYTTLAVFPNNRPVTQTKADVRYLSDHRDRNGVEIYPVGALSKDIKGVDIAEYADMKSAGVFFFSDGLNSVQDTGLLSRALIYSSGINSYILHHPGDSYLTAGGEMHEGEMSTSLGMKGVPDIAEVLMVQRDIQLCKYNQTSIIEHAISSAQSVAEIKNAKDQDIAVFATAPYMNLLFTDMDLYDFNTNFKVIPVLRSEKDRYSLIRGLKDGTIDAIVSNHTPLEDDAKNLEFPYAKPGASGLQTCLAACITHLSQDIDIASLLYKLTIGPRKLLNLPIPSIEEGVKANLCIFDCDHKWRFHADTSDSKSSNNPFIGKELLAKVIWTIANM
jgi:dihydroorotase